MIGLCNLELSYLASEFLASELAEYRRLTDPVALHSKHSVFGLKASKIFYPQTTGIGMVLSATFHDLLQLRRSHCAES